MKCTNCDNEIDENKNFCPSCGAKLGDYKIVVTRIKKTMGFAIPFTVYVDSEKIGDLKNGQAITYNLTKGKHKVLIKSVEKEINQGIVLDDKHKAVEISVYGTMGFLAVRPVLKNIEYK